MSPHLGHKLIAAANLQFEYLGMILDAGDSIEGIATMILGLYDQKNLKQMANKGNVQLVTTIEKIKQKKRKLSTPSPVVQKKRKPAPTTTKSNPRLIELQIPEEKGEDEDELENSDEGEESEEESSSK